MGRFGAALAAFGLSINIAHADSGELDAKQIQIVAKIFNFLDKKPPAHATVLILPNAADLETVKGILHSLNVITGSSADAVGAYAVFVGTSGDAQAVTASNGTAITVTGNVACVDEGKCLIAVETQPKVSIYISRAAAAKAGVEFDANFKMLITER